jgi:hypothetical protein
MVRRTTKVYFPGSLFVLPAPTLGIPSHIADYLILVPKKSYFGPMFTGFL